MPSVDETDRSISPLITISVMGSAMIAISPLDRPRLNRLLLVRKLDEVALPAMPMTSTMTASPASQRNSHGTRDRMSCSTAGAPGSQGRCQLHRDDPVDRDG